MKMNNFMVGVAANTLQPSLDEKKLMQEAGISWLRSGNFKFDQARFLNGEPQLEDFHAVKNQIAALKGEGFNFMGITPDPRRISEVAGTPGSLEYMENYRRMCAFLGGEYRGLINYWQVGNELDIWIFRDKLTLEQSAEFLKNGIRGLKDVDKNLKVGINITLFPSLPGEVDGNTDAHEGVYLARAIYQDSSLDVDYAGFDSYPGTWRKGGAESWHEYLDAFYALTQKPIIIQEFGYSAAGEMMTPEEDESGIYPCKARKWRFSWNGQGHTPEVQAKFIEESFRIFAEKPFVIGATYFKWKDSQRCWQCGKEDCPVETAWGLINRDGVLMPAYQSLKSTVSKYFGARAGKLESVA